ncbi:MAG: GNAT family N-acetyltransferase [Caldilineaceae bacterium]|nr:GNAT family N-acetyltransferase [Caldilineaceae bacterium]
MSTQFQSLPTDRLVIRRFHVKDAEAFVALRNDPEVARFQSWRALDQAAAQSFIAELAKAEPGIPGEWFQFAIADKVTDSLLGDCALQVKADEPRQAEIGFTLARPAQGRGLATEAISALLDYLFDSLQLHRVVALCDVRNHGSYRLLERLGMRREGHTLQSFWNKGSWTDEYQYALLREEWRQRTRSTTTKATTQVVLLGTGTPNADPLRQGSALAVIVADQAYLVDCGPGIVRRAAAAAQKNLPALAPPRLTRAFLTHHHSDHTAGYPDLILTPWVLGRTEPLIVYGPRGTQAMTDHLLAAYAEDIRERRTGLEPANDQGHQVIVHEFEAGLIYRDERVRVEAFRVQHGSWPAFGFKFFTPDRTIGISGDTRPFAGLAQAYRGCDLLIHEVYSVRGFANRPPEWQRYHSQVHTSAHELAALAKLARPGLLVLTHQLFWGVTEDELLAEVRAHYDGPVVSGRDLDMF